MTQPTESRLTRLADTIKWDWKPRRRPGGVYCSPSCGHECAREDFEQATARASVLAERMGDGWTADVWENAGWHYGVSSPCQCISLREHWDWHSERPVSYTAYLGRPGEHAAIQPMKRAWLARGRTPGTAIRRVRKIAAEDVREMAAIAGLSVATA